MAASQPLLTLDLTKVATLTTQQQLFPAILVQSKSFRRAPLNYVVSYDEKADKAGEGSAGSSFGLGGTTGESIGYRFPSLVDGLTLAVQHQTKILQNHSVTVLTNAGMRPLVMAMATNTTDYTSVNVPGTLLVLLSVLNKIKLKLVLLGTKLP